MPIVTARLFQPNVALRPDLWDRTWWRERSLCGGFGKFADPFFAQAFDAAAGVGAGGVEVIDAQIESALEQRLRAVFTFDRTEPSAAAKTDAGNHLAGFP